MRTKDWSSTELKNKLNPIGSNSVQISSNFTKKLPGGIAGTHTNNFTKWVVRLKHIQARTLKCFQIHRWRKQLGTLFCGACGAFIWNCRREVEKICHIHQFDLFEKLQCCTVGMHSNIPRSVGFSFAWTLSSKNSISMLLEYQISFFFANVCWIGQVLTFECHKEFHFRSFLSKRSLSSSWLDGELDRFGSLKLWLATFLFISFFQCGP